VPLVSCVREDVKMKTHRLIHQQLSKRSANTCATGSQPDAQRSAQHWLGLSSQESPSHTCSRLLDTTTVTGLEAR
jgi:hypothetical protein